MSILKKIANAISFKDLTNDLKNFICKDEYFTYYYYSYNILCVDNANFEVYKINIPSSNIKAYIKWIAYDKITNNLYIRTDHTINIYKNNIKIASLCIYQFIKEIINHIILHNKYIYIFEDGKIIVINECGQKYKEYDLPYVDFGYKYGFYKNIVYENGVLIIPYCRYNTIDIISYIFNYSFYNGDML